MNRSAVEKYVHTIVLKNEVEKYVHTIVLMNKAEKRTSQQGGRISGICELRADECKVDYIMKSVYAQGRFIKVVYVLYK